MPETGRGPEDVPTSERMGVLGWTAWHAGCGS